MSQNDDRRRASGQRSRAQGNTSPQSRARNTRRQAQSSAARVNAVRQAQKNSSQRRRKPPFDYTKVAVAVGILIVLVVAVVFGVKSCGRKDVLDETTPAETELKKEVAVNGVSITGMSRMDAKAAILKHLNWDMKVTYEDDEYTIQNLLEPRVDDVLEEIYTKEPKDSYNIDTSNLDEQVKTEVEAMAAKWDVPAKNGAISSFDEASGKFVFSGESDGVVIDQTQLNSDIAEKLNTGIYQGSFAARGVPVKPTITEAQAKEKYKTIGTYTTKTTSNKDRNTNISIAVAALNGMIIQPGEEFSFNTTTGNRTTEKGYKPAGAYVNGVLVEEPGGGVCQVSSTLYNAVVFSGLKTTERHAHSYEPSYVTPGEDAMVSYDGYAGPDMRFVNNSNDAVGIRATFAKQQLTISIYGMPILEEGVTLSMKSEKVAELDPPKPTYEEDQSIELGIEVEAKAAVPGSKWVTNLITKKNGEVVTDEFFHNSTYKGKPATIKRNTSGVVIPKPTESGAEESSPSGESESSSEGTLPSLPAGQATTAPTEKHTEVGPGIPTEAPTQPPTTQAPTQPTTQPGPQPTTAPSAEPTQPATQGGGIISPNPLAPSA